jgi:hypothetical protein
LTLGRRDVAHHQDVTSGLEHSIGQALTDLARVALSSLAGQRAPLPLHHFAMSALSLPKYERKFLKFAKFQHKAVKGGRGRVWSTTKLAASIICPAIGRNGRELTSCWSPPSDLGRDLLTNFFPGSTLSPNGIRYHESRSQATLYFFMAAILNGDESLVGDAIRSTKLVRESLGLPAVLFDNLNLLPKDRHCAAFAIIAKDKHGSLYFSFVDGSGNLVRKQMTS